MRTGMSGSVSELINDLHESMIEWLFLWYTPQLIALALVTLLLAHWVSGRVDRTPNDWSVVTEDDLVVEQIKAEAESEPESEPESESESEPEPELAGLLLSPVGA
jgi:hypothetical protein